MIGFAKIVPWARHPFIDIERLENEQISAMQKKAKTWHDCGRPTQKSLLLRILFEKDWALIERYHTLYEDKFEEALKSGWDEISTSKIWDAFWVEGPKNPVGWDSKLIDPIAS